MPDVGKPFRFSVLRLATIVRMIVFSRVLPCLHAHGEEGLQNAKIFVGRRLPNICAMRES
jgi:hypothetical protein